jgi:hypothetical protein
MVFLATENMDSPRRYIKYAATIPEITVAYKNALLIELCSSTGSAVIRSPLGLFLFTLMQHGLPRGGKFQEVFFCHSRPV